MDVFLFFSMFIVFIVDDVVTSEHVLIQLTDISVAFDSVGSETSTGNCALSAHVFWQCYEP